jgi:hypothetical protein
VIAKPANGLCETPDVGQIPAAPTFQIFWCWNPSSLQCSIGQIHGFFPLSHHGHLIACNRWFPITLTQHARWHRKMESQTNFLYSIAPIVTYLTRSNKIHQL